MGIHGIYKEIGLGQRIALSKLAIEKFEETGRPLRIAIDTSIWLFQIQSSKGGTNPALRTFYYRLLRLLSLSIHPLFVFDGPNKPPMKRNKRTGVNIASIPEFLAKQLLKQFGFPFHLAPGEAEAECALLQREGIVDVVLSEDVDTLMFGSGVTIRNWSPEKSSSKVPTHVNLYDLDKIRKGDSGLDREGMILVAMMSGGDYVPEGIPGCGPKLACEAARAGFGKDLCKISKGDTHGYKLWRERLSYELRTNESKYFTRKRCALIIPEDFPNPEILGYYTKPALSPPSTIARLRENIKWDHVEMDLPALRTFTADCFDWVKLSGAKKFIRSLAPALLIKELRARSSRNDENLDDLEKVMERENELIRAIHGKREHITTDQTSELRVSFLPIDLVKIDLSVEEPDDEIPEAGSDSEAELDAICGNENGEPATKKRGPSTYDPTQLEKVWIFESIIKVGVPLKVQDWEESFRNPRKYLAMKRATRDATKGSKTKKTAKKSEIPRGALDRYTKVTKPGVVPPERSSKRKSPEPQIPTSSLPIATQTLPRSLLVPEEQVSSPPPIGASRDDLPSSQTVEFPASAPKRRRRSFTRAHTIATTTAVDETSRRTRGACKKLETIDILDLTTSPAKPPVSSQLCAPRGTAKIPLNHIFTEPNPVERVKPHKPKKPKGKGPNPSSDSCTTARRQPSRSKSASGTSSRTPLQEKDSNNSTSSSQRSQVSPEKQTPPAAPPSSAPLPTRSPPPIEHLDLSTTPLRHRFHRTTSTTPRADRLITDFLSPSKSHLTSLDAPTCTTPAMSWQQSKGPVRRTTAESVDLTTSPSPRRSPRLTKKVEDASASLDRNRRTAILSPSPSRQKRSNTQPTLLFPNTQTLDQPTSHSKNRTRDTETPVPTEPVMKERPKRRYIELRASLAGAWKFVDDDDDDEIPVRRERERERRSRWRLSEVEVVDLTGS